VVKYFGLKRQLGLAAFALGLVTCGRLKPDASATVAPEGPTANQSNLKFDALVGVAVPGKDDLCFSILNAGLTPRTPVRLIDPDDPQMLLEAQVDGPSKACKGLEADHRARTSYTLSFKEGSVRYGYVMFGIVGSPPVSFKEANTALVLLANDSASYSLRLCYSAEGLHLTIWGETPLKGTRLWHLYYYLGYDSENTCTSQEMAE
jgi:hypothetical protein